MLPLLALEGINSVVLLKSLAGLFTFTYDGHFSYRQAYRRVGGSR